jgi:hypothetical protein
MPKRPLRCWQYRKASDDAIPRWLTPFLMMQANMKLEFVWPNNGGQQELPDGAWVVLLDDGKNSDAYCCWYTKKEFADQFKVQP